MRTIGGVFDLPKCTQILYHQQLYLVCHVSKLVSWPLLAYGRSTYLIFLQLYRLYYHPNTLSSMAKLEGTRSGSVFNGWVLAVGALGMSLLNLLVVTPWTSKLMFKRHRLEKQEGKSYSDPTVSSAFHRSTKRLLT